MCDVHMMQVIDPKKQLPQDFPLGLIGKLYLIFQVTTERISRAQFRDNTHTLSHLVDLVYFDHVWMIYFFEQVKLLKKLLLDLRIQQDALLQQLDRPQLLCPYIFALINLTKRPFAQLLLEGVLMLDVLLLYSDELLLVDIDVQGIGYV